MPVQLVFVAFLHPSLLSSEPLPFAVAPSRLGISVDLLPVVVALQLEAWMNVLTRLPNPDSGPSPAHTVEETPIELVSSAPSERVRKAVVPAQL